MKLNTQLLLFIAILFSWSSCQKESEMRSENLSEKFIIYADELRNGSHDIFIMANSESTGEVLYWDIGLGFEDVIEFENPNSETIDLTYGFEYERGFRITTYRGIKSGFNLSGYIYPCHENDSVFDSLSQKTAEIILEGTTELVEVINPLYYQDIDLMQDTISPFIEIKDNVIYDYEKNNTRIKGVLDRSIIDLQFTFRFLGEENYRSLIVKREDWVQVDSRNYKKEIKIEDLVNTSYHEIEIEKEEDAGWALYAEILTTDDRRIIISRTNYKNIQYGDKLRLFIQDDLQLDELTLQVRGNYRSLGEGFHYQKKFNTIPSSISFKKFNPEIIQFNTEDFEVSIPENYNLVATKYSYNIESYLSVWSIYQTSNATPEYEFPRIISEYLDNTELMKRHLPVPDYFTIETYLIDEVDFDNRYQETGIDRQLRCLNFDSSYKVAGF